jgi:GMP synthase-like glutamine amidotransferase
MRLPDENKDRPNWLHSNVSYTAGCLGTGNLDNLYKGTQRTRINDFLKTKMMKILLINNNTVHLKKLHQALAGHDVEMQLYTPGLDFHYQDKDLIILSGGGGEGLEISDEYTAGHLWYEDQMEFILKCKKPMIGICMGFEVIARAFGQSVPKMPGLLTGKTELKATEKGKKLFNTNSLSQYEAHSWHITSAPKGFKVLADSNNGIEIIQNKNIFATQFHPEHGGSLQLSGFLKS